MMAHAKTVSERAAKILRDHCDRIDDLDDLAMLEALERDPHATLMHDRTDEQILEDLEVMLGLRAAPPEPAPEPEPASRPTPAPPTAPKAASAVPERVQRAADNAEIETLRKEVWRLRDFINDLGMFLAPELRSLSGRKRAYVSMFLGHCSHGFGSLDLWYPGGSCAAV